MLIKDIIMWIATSLSIIMYSPQVYKTVKSKDASSLSKITFLFILFATANYTLSLSTVSDGGYWANFVIMFLMIPVFWYIFIKNKKWFFVILFFSIAVAASSLYLYIEKPKFSHIIQYIFAINSAGVLALAFWPQTISIIKTKKIESYSLIMGIATMIANGMWVIYWALKIDPEGETHVLFTAAITLVASSSVVITQILIMGIYLLYNKKRS